MCFIMVVVKTLMSSYTFAIEFATHILYRGIFVWPSPDSSISGRKTGQDVWGVKKKRSPRRARMCDFDIKNNRNFFLAVSFKKKNFPHRRCFQLFFFGHFLLFMKEGMWPKMMTRISIWKYKLSIFEIQASNLSLGKRSMS